MKRRSKTVVLLALAVVVVLAACESEVVQPKFKSQLGTPLDPATDPPYTVTDADLSSAYHCAVFNPSSTWDPLLLVGSGLADSSPWLSSLASSGRLADAGKVCSITVHSLGQPMTGDQADFSRSAQYVAYAIHRLATETGRSIGVIAHSRGGIDTRWALRWWPSTRAEVDDVVLIGVPNHGSVDNEHALVTTTTTTTTNPSTTTTTTTTSAPPTTVLLSPSSRAAVPIFEQSRADSLFTMALNSFDETPGSPSYTNIASRNDPDSVGSGTYDSRTKAWQLTGATNLLVQDSCSVTLNRPDVRDNGWVWAAAVDAITHSGPADPSRFSAAAPCTPGTTPEPAPTDVQATEGWDGEPPLPDYVPMLPEEVAPITPLSVPTSDPGDGSRTLTESAAALDLAYVCGTSTDVWYSPHPTLAVAGANGDGTTLMKGVPSGPFKSTGLGTRFVHKAPGDPAPAGMSKVCWIDLPGRATSTGPAVDLARGAQYVVNAIRKSYAAAGAKIDIIAHSRGGFDTLWALKWWPDLQTKVDDVVLLGTPTRGAKSQDYGVCTTPNPSTTTTAPAIPYPADPLMCYPFGHQSRADSQFIHALFAGDPTPGSISYTTIDTWDAPKAASQRSALDNRQYAWKLVGATNVVVQQYCAMHRVDHSGLLSDAFVGLVIDDAFDHSGPAVPGRFMLQPAASCTGEYRASDGELEVTSLPPAAPDEEPALPPYVWNHP